jgi:trehalose 6-phosphate synthase
LRRADVVFVNSVRDGMNLVVLEALVLSEREPAVVISREMGAIEVLGDDVIAVNPFDVSAGAEALHAALLMGADERAERAKRMRAAAVRLPPTEWFRAQLDALPGGDSAEQ